MKPVDQTKFGYPEGNCFQAALASILELPIDDVPYFIDDDWWKRYQNWLVQLGLWMVDIDCGKSPNFKPLGYTIMSGMSPRGKFLHATIAYNGQLVHDPHPDRTGIVNGGPLEHTMLVTLDPAIHGSGWKYKILEEQK